MEIINKIKNKYVAFFILAILLMVIFFVSINSFRRAYRSENLNVVQLAGKEIAVDIARTDEQREQGLSGRIELKEDEGMLFVFEKGGKHPFWMKDMNFGIDIIWISEDKKVIYIKKNALPESYPEIYGLDASMENAKYVLEVVSGFSDKNNLKEGDSVDFEF